MLRNNRVILSKNGVLTDLSVNLSNPLSGVATINIVATQDAIYLGSDLPFNHRYIEVSTANDQASVASVKVWNGSSWVSTVDVVDETSPTGTTLAQSGILSWTPDRTKAWVRQYGTESISELSSLVIYDLFWAKITFSQNLKGTTALKYIGHKFSKDEDLFAEYPDLADTGIMAAFASGKTNWNDQTFLAAEYIIDELRSRNIIWSKDQILDWSRFKHASVHKTAAIIYSAFGEDYRENVKIANQAHNTAMDSKFFNTDQDENAILTDGEKQVTTIYQTR